MTSIVRVQFFVLTSLHKPNRLTGSPMQPMEPLCRSRFVDLWKLKNVNKSSTKFKKFDWKFEQISLVICAWKIVQDVEIWPSWNQKSNQRWPETCYAISRQGITSTSTKDGRTRKIFLWTWKMWIITFGKYIFTFIYGQLPLENIYEYLNMDNLCVGISS